MATLGSSKRGAVRSQSCRRPRSWARVPSALALPGSAFVLCMVAAASVQASGLRSGPGTPLQLLVADEVQLSPAESPYMALGRWLDLVALAPLLGRVTVPPHIDDAGHRLVLIPPSGSRTVPLENVVDMDHFARKWTASSERPLAVAPYRTLETYLPKGGRKKWACVQLIPRAHWGVKHSQDDDVDTRCACSTRVVSTPPMTTCVAIRSSGSTAEPDMRALEAFRHFREVREADVVVLQDWRGVARANEHLPASATTLGTGAPSMVLPAHVLQLVPVNWLVARAVPDALQGQQDVVSLHLHISTAFAVVAGEAAPDAVAGRVGICLARLLDFVKTVLATQAPHKVLVHVEPAMMGAQGPPPHPAAYNAWLAWFKAGLAELPAAAVRIAGCTDLNMPHGVESLSCAMRVSLAHMAARHTVLWGRSTSTLALHTLLHRSGNSATPLQCEGLADPTVRERLLHTVLRGNPLTRGPSALGHHLPYPGAQARRTRQHVLEELHAKGRGAVTNDTTNHKPPSLDFDPSYKAPCWTERSNGRFQCLPFFFIGGPSKTASTELYDKVKQHPLVLGGFKKEPHFWDQFTTGRVYPAYKPQSAIHSWKLYMDMFEPMTEEIRRDAEGTRVRVFGDGTTHTFTSRPTARAPGWPITVPEAIRAHTPQVRVIFLHREPVSRYYSHYNYDGVAQKLGKSFDEWANEEIDDFQKCARNAGLDWVVCMDSLPSHFRLFHSLYLAHYHKWRLFFPRRQLMFIETAELAANPHAVYERVFAFLDVGSPGDKWYQSVLQQPRSNVARNSSEPMSERTKARLQRFFQPLEAAFYEQVSSSVGVTDLPWPWWGRDP